MGERHQLKALTSVRGIAAWIVVLFHTQSASGTQGDVIFRFANHGYLAVDFFFVLSGFVIWMNYAERIRSGGIGAVANFLRRRIARIWPLHMFVLGWWVALVIGLKIGGFTVPAMFPFSRLPLQILLIQNWGFTRGQTWNFPAWSISAEMLAYLLFPLLAFRIDWRRIPAPLTLAAIMAMSGLLYAICQMVGWDTLLPSITRLGVIRCLIEFPIGTAVCGLWLRWRDQWKLPAAGAAITAIVLIALWDTAILPEPLAVPLAFAALLLALALTAGKPGNPLEVAPLHYLGEISYATYLSHTLLLYCFGLIFARGGAAQPWPIVTAYLALVLICSIPLYHFVERPAQRWINTGSWQGWLARWPWKFRLPRLFGGNPR